MAVRLVNLLGSKGMRSKRMKKKSVVDNEEIMVNITKAVVLPLDMKKKNNRRKSSGLGSKLASSRIGSSSGFNTLKKARKSVTRTIGSFNASMLMSPVKNPVEFHVKVTGKNGDYVVKKTHKQFRNLHKCLKSKFPQVKQFVKNYPKLKDTEGQTIEEMRDFSQQYLELLVKLKPRPADLNKFLDTHLHIKELVGKPKKGFNSLNDFELVKRIGEGSFGRVFLVRAIVTDEIFALKVLNKQDLRKKNQVEHTMTEMKVMAVSEHPFIVSLKFAFHNKDRLFMVTEYCPGGELFFHLKSQRRLNEETVRIYTGEIGLALGYLHEKNIIYRDLKPENILLDTEGHVLITDFGLSRQDVTGPYDAKTFCGTPEYLSPEMLKHRTTKEGYGKGVDWWSLGILVFEMLYGLPPFYHKNLKKMCERILHKRLSFPDKKTKTSSEVKDLIRGLLDRDSETRIGVVGGGFDEFKGHPFFNDLDWDKLYKREYDSPYKPMISSDPLNTDNFDKEFTGKPARLSGSNSSKVQEAVDDEFENFDYSCFSKDADEVEDAFWA